jgi:DedD protein
VTDLSHDAGEDAFHEIQLSGKQLVFLFMVTTVISVLIFLCGVMVGRGVHAESVSAAGTPPANQSEPVSTSGPAVADRTPPPAVTPPAPPAEGSPQLSYPNALQSAKPPADELHPSAADAKKTANAPKSAAHVPAPEPETRTPPPVAAPPAAAPAAAPAPPPASSSGASKSGVWAVQVVALTDRAAATAVVQRLTAKGYPAFLVNPQSGAPVQNYKVQVGRYADRAEAEQIKTRLKREEQFEPWILR